MSGDLFEIPEGFVESLGETTVLDTGNLLVRAHVPEETYDHLNGPDYGEVTIEMSLDNEIVLVLAFPHDGAKVDRDEVAQLFAIAGAAIPQILDQMEAPQ